MTRGRPNKKINQTPWQLLKNSKIVLFLLIIFGAYAIAFNVFPVPFEPQYYQAPPIPDYSKYQSKQDSFLNVQLFSHPTLKHPEDLYVDQKQIIYTGLQDGSIIRIQNDIMHLVYKSSGFILGVKLIKQNQVLIFIDLKLGICQLNLTTNSAQVLVDNYKGHRLRFLNNLDVAADGKIYFTQASSKYPQQDFFEDFLEGKGYGRVYVFDPVTNETTLLVDNLYFANGIALSLDQTQLYYAEMYRYRIWRYYLVGQRAGTTQIVIDNLIGLPDNIKINSLGQLWLAFPVFRDQVNNIIGALPFLRKILYYLPKAVKPYLAGSKYSGGLKINPKTGEILKYLKGDTSRLYYVTTIFERNNKLYLGSLLQATIGILES